jgi:hypothetical protein
LGDEGRSARGHDAMLPVPTSLPEQIASDSKWLAEIYCGIRRISREAVYEVSVPVKKVFENHRKYQSKVWFDTAVGISNWCKLTGNFDLAPDDFRHLLKKE